MHARMQVHACMRAHVHSTCTFPPQLLYSRYVLYPPHLLTRVYLFCFRSTYSLTAESLPSNSHPFSMSIRLSLQPVVSVSPLFTKSGGDQFHAGAADVISASSAARRSKVGNER